MAFFDSPLKINVLTQKDFISTLENMGKYAEYFLRNHRSGNEISYKLWSILNIKSCFVFCNFWKSNEHITSCISLVVIAVDFAMVFPDFFFFL